MVKIINYYRKISILVPMKKKKYVNKKRKVRLSQDAK